MSTETHRNEAAGSPSVVHYFVDESGDPTLFDSKGRVLVGKDGCSRFFMLGLLEVADPYGLAQRLTDLRSRLLSDPYFRGVPSMQPDALKTALAFHAKDDLPEVRREVFALLKEEDVRFFAVVRSKKATLSYVRSRNRMDPDYHYRPNELYDYLVRRLFRDRLHQSDRNVIRFAQRGKSDRTRALVSALEAARLRYGEKWGRPVETVIELALSLSKDHGGLQAVDYFLWALHSACTNVVKSDSFISSGRAAGSCMTWMTPRKPSTEPTITRRRHHRRRG